MGTSASSRAAAVQLASNGPVPAPHLRVLSIRIYVRNHDRALKFYVDQLGFKVVYDALLQSGDRLLAVAPPDGTAMLSLIVPKPDSPEQKLVGRATNVIFITEDVVTKFQEWSGRGVRFQSTPRLRRIKYDRDPKQNYAQQAPAPPAAAIPADGSTLLGSEAPIWGGVFARFKDIDGNSFELVSFDEVTHALEAQRRAAAEKLELERRSAQEIEIAKRVQAQLFPQRLPSLRTLDYAGICIQAHHVGGDYYDFLTLGRERVGLVIGDISGKGIAAALLMASLQANLRSLCAIALDEPQRLLQSVNQLFCENTTDSAYATLFFAEYDDASQRLRYVNCGHLSALLLRANDGIENAAERAMENATAGAIALDVGSGIDRLDSTGTVVGLFKEWDCTVGERQLSAGDILALYTDGVTESFNARDEEFGERKLIEALRRHRALEAESMVAAIVNEVRAFGPHQHDDITLIVAKCRPAASPAA